MLGDVEQPVGVLAVSVYTREDGESPIRGASTSKQSEKRVRKNSQSQILERRHETPMVQS